MAHAMRLIPIIALASEYGCKPVMVLAPAQQVNDWPHPHTAVTCRPTEFDGSDQHASNYMSDLRIVSSHSLDHIGSKDISWK